MASQDLIPDPNRPTQTTPMIPPAHQTLQRIHFLDRSSSTFPDQLGSLLQGQEYRQCAENVGDNDLAWLVDYLDEVYRRSHVAPPIPLTEPAQALDILDPPSFAFRRCLSELRSICGIKAILPASYALSFDHLSIHPEPFASGEHSDVYGGTLSGSKVCIKRPCVYQDDKITRRISKVCHCAITTRHRPRCS